jgi:Kef-type K+ transport system membrane component KefB/Trk K+ transport system NAD-binding subunit
LCKSVVVAPNLSLLKMKAVRDMLHSDMVQMEATLTEEKERLYEELFEASSKRHVLLEEMKGVEVDIRTQKKKNEDDKKRKAMLAGRGGGKSLFGSDEDDGHIQTSHERLAKSIMAWSLGGDDADPKGMLHAMLQVWSEYTVEQRDLKRAKSKYETAFGEDVDSDDEDIEDLMREADQEERDHGGQGDGFIGGSTNRSTLLGSALSLGFWAQVAMYLVAFAGIVFVFVAKWQKLGGDTPYPACGDSSDDAHRRLSPIAPSLLITHIGYCIAGAGFVTFLVHVIGQPLILGYLITGFLLGPEMLNIVHSHEDITLMASLGLIFLLFMIGLELDVMALLGMGKTVIATGLCQFPLCVGCHVGTFMALNAAGIGFGTGQYPVLYTGLCCGISSTMIVVKLLADFHQSDTTPGRLTVGILIFQDVWAIIVLAIQPDLANPQPQIVGKQFALIAGLIVVAMTYAKFVLPVVFVSTSNNTELMLVLGCSWCFFLSCFATLPFIGLSMELASLVAGVSMATFPYSAEFNGKLKYIRDFFITLFFVALGMQIPMPTIEAIGKGLLVAVVVLMFRWLGIFSVVALAGGGTKLAALATINLSQISEFALVICSLGISFEHVEPAGGEEADTLTILIWTFSVLAILSSYNIKFNYTIYEKLAKCMRRLRGKKEEDQEMGGESGEGHDEHHAHRNIVFLGFDKVAAQLAAFLDAHSPDLLEKINVVDGNEKVRKEVEKKNMAFHYGDVSSPDVLEHAHHGEADLVVCSIPDIMLNGYTNRRLLEVSKSLWPNADVIVTADNPNDARTLYTAGAAYVLRMSNLCADKLHDLVIEHCTQAVVHKKVGEGGSLKHVFDTFKEQEKNKQKQLMEDGKKKIEISQKQQKLERSIGA